jgi:hypothetical protein
MATPITNFGLVTVDGLYNDVVTSVALETGEGSRLPETTGGYTYPMTWWNATDYAHPADDPNVEIVLVTTRATDTLTVTRAQEGTAASTKNTADKTYRMSLGITKLMWESLRTPTQVHHGLQLRTHRDSDLAPYQVEIVDVDSIIMDDGTELRNDNDEWAGKLADITVSGAGGLDSGAEEEDQWYDIYAIAKEDGTRALILRASPEWATNAQHTGTDDATQGIRSAVDNSTVKVAQGFQLSSQSGVCPYVEAKLIKVGAPTGKIWFTIETDNAGKPSGTALATSVAYDVARLPTSALDVRFPMKSSETLSTATQYHLVAQGNWTISATNYIGWRMDGSAGSYASGSKALYDSDTATWTTDTDDDMIFGVGVEEDTGVLTYPTGYTKKCFLGWVKNLTDFIPFVQVNRERRTLVISDDNCLLTATTGAAQIIGTEALLPPRAIITATVALTGTGTGAALAALGDLSATDISSAGSTVGAQVVLFAGATIQVPTQFVDVIVQARSVMAMGTDGAKLWVTGFKW